MTNPNDNKSYREVHQDSYTESDGNTYTSVTRTSETVDNSSVDPNSYESGHVRGRTSERNYQEHRLAEVYEDNASGGFLLGLLLVLLAGLTVGAVWFFTQRDETRNNTPPAPTVTVTPTQTPQSQTKIIERTKEVAVPVERTKEVPVPFPVPQQNSSPPTVNTTPNINITVPSQTPASKSTAPVSPANSSSSSSKETSSNSATSPTPTPTSATGGTAPSADLTPSNSSSQ
jgi:hypothetical protein